MCIRDSRGSADHTEHGSDDDEDQYEEEIIPGGGEALQVLEPRERDEHHRKQYRPRGQLTGDQLPKHDRDQRDVDDVVRCTHLGGKLLQLSQRRRYLVAGRQPEARARKAPISR